MSEYGVAFGFFPVVADEVVGVLQMGCDFRILVFDPVDFEAFYTYIIYRGRFQDPCMSQEIFVSSPSVRSMMFLSMCVTISCMLRR